MIKACGQSHGPSLGVQGAWPEWQLLLLVHQDGYFHNKPLFSEGEEGQAQGHQPNAIHRNQGDGCFRGSGVSQEGAHGFLSHAHTLPSGALSISWEFLSCSLGSIFRDLRPS